MAVAEVGGGTQRATIRGTSVDSANGVFPANVTSGNLLLATGASWQSGSGNTTIPANDTRSTSYTTQLQTGLTWAGGVGRQFFCYGIAPSSGACTVTVDPSGTGNYINGVVDEFSGVDATPFDADGGQTTGTTSDVTWTDDITTVTANDLLVGVAVADGTCGLTAGSGCTLIDTDGTAARQPYGAVIKIITGGAATETVEMDTDTARNFAIGSVAFQETQAAVTDTGFSGWPIFRPKLWSY